MELCCSCSTACSLPNPNSELHRFPTKNSRLDFNHSFSLKSPAQILGGLSHSSSSTLLRATSDDASKSTVERRNYVGTLEDFSSVDNVASTSQGAFDENKDHPSADGPVQLLNELLEKLNIELDSENSYTIFLYGGGAVVALWLLSAIVGAIDSIPVFPKLMEVVGLGYSLWFTTRYLLFKKNREELVSKIEELKKEILGSSDD